MCGANGTSLSHSTNYSVNFVVNCTETNYPVNLVVNYPESTAFRGSIQYTTKFTM